MIAVRRTTGNFANRARRRTQRARVSPWLPPQAHHRWEYRWRRLRLIEIGGAQALSGDRPAAYQSGLLFNPVGYRSYYLRSECFQRIAIEFRDQKLCDLVKPRHSLFSSSWGYSKAQCGKLVHEGLAADEKILWIWSSAIERERCDCAIFASNETARAATMNRSIRRLAFKPGVGAAAVP